MCIRDRLYVKRVFIMDDAEQFLPLYMRFIKGVVDSSDLPLNVSRELLQQDEEVEAIKSGLTKRVLDMLCLLYTSSAITQNLYSWANYKNWAERMRTTWDDEKK